MYEEKLWKDHVTEFEDRYREEINGDGTINHIKVEGEVREDGTPQSAKNFFRMEKGIHGAGAIAGLLAIQAIHTRQAIEDLSGEVVSVTLNDTEQYPFQNNKKTVALKTPRNSVNYTVQPEIVSATGGSVKSVGVTEKLKNGFKVEFTGSAKKVELKIHIKGGFYNG